MRVGKACPKIGARCPLVMGNMLHLFQTRLTKPLPDRGYRDKFDRCMVKRVPTYV